MNEKKTFYIYKRNLIALIIYNKEPSLGSLNMEDL
jgi:hypothetical protein